MFAYGIGARRFLRRNGLMLPTMHTDEPYGHPWLAEFRSSPAAALEDLIRGHAAISPYEHAEAPDAARQLFGGLEDMDPALRALDEAVIQWIDQRRRKPIPSNKRARGRVIREASDVFEITAALELRKSARWLLEHRLLLFDWTARLVVSSARDARAAFLRTLALTQRIIEDDEATNLASVWLDICRHAGDGLPKYYLDIGLLGLRRLPPIEQQTSECPWLAGLAHWALSRNPSYKEFMAEWGPLKRLYPRTPKAWRSEIAELLGTRTFRDAEIEPPGWWGNDADLAPLSRSDVVLPDPHFSPMPDECRALIAQFNSQFEEVEGAIDNLMQRHVRFARATGISQHLVAAAHMLGKALVDHGGSEKCTKAAMLSRLGIEWGPFNPFLWELWADALEGRGAVKASEVVRWESVRRLPFNIDARTQLAEFLIVLNRLAEADNVVEQCFSDGLEDEVTHSLRIRLALYLRGADAARNAASVGLSLFPDDKLLRDLLEFLSSGREDRVWLVSRHYQTRPIAPVDAAEAPVADHVIAFRQLARARELSSLLTAKENDAALSEVRNLLREEPEFAYAQLLAARIGAWERSSTSLPTFAGAFEEALNKEDQSILEKLGEQAPRLAALTLLARAIFGDADAQARITEWLASSESNEILTVDALRSQVRSALGDQIDHVRAPTALVAKKELILNILRRANEALLTDTLLAA